MPVTQEIPRISDLSLHLAREKERLLRLIDPYHKEGWATTLGVIAQEIIGKPDWLTDGQSLPQYAQANVEKLLQGIRERGLSSLDDLSEYTRDSLTQTAFVIRFMEIFARKFNFPNVWRGGELGDVEGGSEEPTPFLSEKQWDLFNGHILARGKIHV